MRVPRFDPHVMDPSLQTYDVELLELQGGDWWLPSSETGIYTELEEETLLFDRSFDFVVAPEITLIMKQESFQGSLDYLADVRANAVEILVSVTAEVPIHNFEELSAAVSRQLGMISKLASVAERFRTDPAYAASMNLENIIAFAGAHPGREIDLEGPEDDKKLRFYPDPQRRWKIPQAP